MKSARELLLHEPLKRALDLLDRDGEEARLVGGAVRNALMGRPVADYDIATTAPPKVVMARAVAAGLKVKPTGIAHGTVTLLVDHHPLEITTLREDIATDGRHATVRFGRDFAQDALRRDFTINALSLSRDGTIHDYSTGLDDLGARRVRFIGAPETRIREDYLRILRFFRFSAEYGEGPLDADGLAASIRLRAGLARLSRERIRVELLKLLVARRAAEIVAVFADTGLLAPLIEAVPQPRRLARLVAHAPEADAVLRLAALAAIVREDAARLQERLRLSNADALRLDAATSALAHLHGSGPPNTQMSRTLLYRYGRAAAMDSVALASAAARSEEETAWRTATSFVARAEMPVLPFTGKSLIACGIAPGKPLGEALRRLSKAWVDAGFPQDPETLSKILTDLGFNR